MAFRTCVCHFNQIFPHVPRPGGTTLRAQSAMQADVLVLGHDAAGLEGVRNIDVLGEVLGRRLEVGAQLSFGGVGQEGDAVHRADVDAGVAFDAQRGDEYGLDVAVEAAFRLLKGELRVEAKLNLGLDILERHDLVAQRHAEALVGRDLVVVAPLVDAHLLAHHIDGWKRTNVNVLAGEHHVDRYGGLVAVGDRPDDVLRAECGVAAEEHLRVGRAHGLGIDFGHVPFVEFDADVALDPGKRILLADGDEDIVAGNMLVGFAGRDKVAPAFGIVLGFHLFEDDAGEAAIIVGESFGYQEIEDRDAFVHRVLLLPWRGLHLFEAGTHHDGDLFAAEPARGTAAVHGGVAAAEHDDALADLVDVAERNAGQPVDADVDVFGRFLAARNIEVTTARGAGADKDSVEILGKQLPEAVDALPAAELHAEIENVAAFLVDDGLRQAEPRNLRADHAACLGVAVEHHAGVTKRCEIAGNREGGRAAADKRDALSVLACGRAWQAGPDVVLEIGGDALEAADCHRLLLDTTAPARRLTGPVASATKHAGKHIRFPVDHIGVGVAPGCDQANVFRNWRVRRTSPLAINYLVEIVGRRNVGWFHTLLMQRSLPAGACDDPLTIPPPGFIVDWPFRTAAITIAYYTNRNCLLYQINVSKVRRVNSGDQLRPHDHTLHHIKMTH